MNRWRTSRIAGIRWWWIVLAVPLAVLGAVNAVAVAGLINATLHRGVPNDWVQFQMAADRISHGVSPYTIDPPWTFRWSPIAAWFLVPLTAVGPVPWMIAQFGSLLALPRGVALLALVTVPFWADVYEGNILTFSLVLAVVALRGNRLASLAYLALAMLVPRPLMLPVAVWLLWKRPDLRLPTLGILVLQATLVAVSGYAGEWFQRLITSGDEIALHNAGPSALIGLWWIPIGIALAVFFTWRGRLGLASLAISPYLILYYWIFGLLEFVPSVQTASATARAA